MEDYGQKLVSSHFCQLTELTKLLLLGSRTFVNSVSGQKWKFEILVRWSLYGHIQVSVNASSFSENGRGSEVRTKGDAQDGGPEYVVKQDPDVHLQGTGEDQNTCTTQGRKGW